MKEWQLGEIFNQAVVFYSRCDSIEWEQGRNLKQIRVHLNSKWKITLRPKLQSQNPKFPYR
jgi:hypothetical protein